jgi:hypothetical protein
MNTISFGGGSGWVGYDIGADNKYSNLQDTFNSINRFLQEILIVNQD